MTTAAFPTTRRRATRRRWSRRARRRQRATHARSSTRLLSSLIEVGGGPMAAAARAERGGVQRDTYERVKAALAANPSLTTRDAFARIAQETGRSVGTIQTSYYRMAREDPNTTVKARPRSGKRTAGRPRAVTKPAASRGSDGSRASAIGELDAHRTVPRRSGGAARLCQADRPRAEGPRPHQGAPAVGPVATGLEKLAGAPPPRSRRVGLAVAPRTRRRPTRPPEAPSASTGA